MEEHRGGKMPKSEKFIIIVFIVILLVSLITLPSLQSKGTSGGSGREGSGIFTTMNETLFVDTSGNVVFNVDTSYDVVALIFTTKEAADVSWMMSYLDGTLLGNKTPMEMSGGTFHMDPGEISQNSFSLLPPANKTEWLGRWSLHVTVTGSVLATIDKVQNWIPPEY